MKLVFIGTVKFSLKALSHLVGLEANVAGVVTRSASRFNADYADLTPICRSCGIPVRYADRESPEDIRRWVRSLEPDFIFCFGWSNLLEKNLIEIAKAGTIGFHPAKLPENRGRHPLIWALALGLEQTASTFFFMDEGADSGDLLSQDIIEIDYADDAGSLYGKIEDHACRQMDAFLPLLESGTYRRTPQEHRLANYWRKRTVEDGRIDFRMSSRSIYNLARALARPYVGAHLLYRGAPIKIWRVAEVGMNKNNIEPGKILSADDNGVLVKSGENAVCLCDHEFETLPQVGEYLK